ncbi:hypothetical protein AB0P36_21865 [Streptomyces flavidovirens]|uniref:hypothetical protein n=1 Tax=Streptomyces flavidovirens TaxID=67298 RepID=UPI00341FEDF6
MKIQERAGAGNDRVSAPTGPIGERLPSAPRERKPALAALAVLLILVGALGATVLVLRAGERIEVVKITQRVPAGKPVGASARVSVLVAEDEAINYVRWNQLAQLDELRAKTDLLPGTLLVGEMLGTDKGLAQGKAAVGLSLKAGQYPQDIEAGSNVAIYRVGSSKSSGNNNSAGSTGGSGAATDSLLVPSAKIQGVTTTSGDDVVSSGTLPVSVLVDQAEAAAVTEAAAAGEVALVLVPSGNN